MPIHLVCAHDAATRIAPRSIVQIAARVLGLAEHELCATRGGRQLIVHVGHKLGLSLAEIAGCLGVSVHVAWRLSERGVPPALQETLAIVLCQLVS